MPRPPRTWRLLVKHLLLPGARKAGTCKTDVLCCFEALLGVGGTGNIPTFWRLLWTSRGQGFVVQTYTDHVCASLLESQTKGGASVLNARASVTGSMCRMRATLGLQIAQSRSYSFTLGLKVGIVLILGAPGLLSKKPFFRTAPFEPHSIIPRF